MSSSAPDPGVRRVSAGSPRTTPTAFDDVTVFVSDGTAVDLTVALVDASALVVEPQSLVVTGTLAAQIVNTGPGVVSGCMVAMGVEHRNEVLRTSEWHD